VVLDDFPGLPGAAGGIIAADDREWSAAGLKRALVTLEKGEPVGNCGEPAQWIGDPRQVRSAQQVEVMAFFRQPAFDGIRNIAERDVGPDQEIEHAGVVDAERSGRRDMVHLPFAVLAGDFHQFAGGAGRRVAFQMDACVFTRVGDTEVGGKGGCEG
jgi:hypothetical protein